MQPLRKFASLFILHLLLAFMACKLPVISPSTPPAPAPPASPTPTLQAGLVEPLSSAQAPAYNPFGLMVDGRTARQRVQIAKSLGAVYFRPWDVDVSDWGGRCADRACESALEEGLALVLTVRNGGQAGPPPLPSAPPADLNAYRLTLGVILDRYHPEILVVENEETSSLYWSGSPEEYAVTLQAACAVAHEHSTPCTNGGLASQAVGLATWASYIEQGQTAEACDFARRTLAHDQAEAFCGMKSVAELPEEAQASLAKVRGLLALYKPMGADFINFHWYSPDAQALSEAVAFLEGAAGLPAMTNEFGLREQDPQALRLIMERLTQLGLRYAIAFSLDNQAVALQNADGSLRPNGEAFQAFISETFGRR